MKVEMKIHITGSRNGVRWPQAGGVVDLPDNEARDLVDQGLAKPLAVAKKAAEVVKKVERAVASKPEKRA